MNEKRPIDANLFAEHLERMTRTAYPNMFPGLLKAIEYARDFPTVDAVEVVSGLWIPVTERLPEENQNYIVTACDEGCPYGEGIWYDTVVVVAEYYKGSWTWNDNGVEYDLSGIVTHWMPLPEPPKEVQ